MKKLNWKPIEPRNISKTSLWVACQEESLVTEDIFQELFTNFSSKPCKIVLPNVSSKIIDQTLDRKSVQNILIFKRGLMKGLSNEQIMQAILQCEISVETIEGLIECLPKSDQLKRFCDMKETSHQMSEAEDFVATLVEIPELVPRLRSIRFKNDFADMVKDFESNMIVATTACKEIKESKKLAKVLELILSIGNYMNSGSTCAPAFGFEISFITKICDTKDSGNKWTLLHFLVDLIKRKYPNLLGFGDDMPHLEEVSNVHSEKIHLDMLEMTESMKELEFVLEKSVIEKSPNDKFAEKMSDFFMQCKNQLEILKKVKDQMENAYKVVAEYLSFESIEYPMEELFSDLKKFKRSFQQACVENLGSKSKLKNRKQVNNENAKIYPNRKPVTCFVSDENIRKLCQRNLIINVKNMSNEGLYSYTFFLFISFLSK